MTLVKCVLGVVAGLAATAAAAQPPRADFAPVWERTGVTEVQANDWRALGPLLESSTRADGRQSQGAWPRPFYTEWRAPDEGWVYRDYLWPFGFSRHHRDGGFEVFALFLHTAPDGVTEKDPERWWFLPMFFYGRDRNGQSYAGLFPIWGQVCNLVGYEHVGFRFFPLYLETQKKDVHSRSWLWPIVSRTDGERVTKRRVFPFWGFARNQEKEQRFVLWPFWHAITRFPDEQGRAGNGWLLLPFYGRYRQTDRQGGELHRAWTCVWPFFSGETGGGHSRLYCPWPFYRRETDVTKEGPVNRFHVWPFYGYDAKPGRGDNYLGWPFWQTWQTAAGKTETDLRVLMPLYWAADRREAGVQTRCFREVWPLWRRDGIGTRTRHTVLSLWPAPHSEPIERNYAPFWTLYTRDQDGDRVCHEILWGLGKVSWRAPDPLQVSFFPLFAWRRTGDGYDFSFGKGLFRFGQDSLGAHHTCFWFLDW